MKRSPFAMQVPKGGSMCANCMYANEGKCTNLDFIDKAEGYKKKGEDRFVDPRTGKTMPGDQYCCCFYDTDKV